jgi:uncharacterized membrane protein YbhN (UPF0104 family)
VWGAKLAVGVGLIAWLVADGKLQVRRLLEVPLGGSFALLGIAVGVSLVLPVWRWWWLLRIQRVREPFAKVLTLTWVGYFTGLFLPGAASGDLAKGYFIWCRHPRMRARALSTVLADRALGLFSLVFLGSISTAWLVMTGGFSGAAFGIALVNLVLFTVMFVGACLALSPLRVLLLRVVPARIRIAFEESIDLYRASKGGILGCFIISVLSSLLTVLALAVAAGLVGQEIPPEATLVAGPLIILSNCLPFSPGGVGLAETVSDRVFNGLGLLGGAEAMLLLRLWIVLLSLPGLLRLFGPLAVRSQVACSPAATEA